MRNLQFPTNLVNKLGVNQLQDITDQLPKNPAYSWAELAVINGYPAKRDINDLTTIVLHHTAVPKSSGATAARHATNHINGRAYEKKGEPGIPYHFYIRAGQAYQVNDVLDRVYGVGSNNAYTVHICVEGEYAHTDALTDADRAALYATIITVKTALPNFQAIKAHGELNETECPGYDYNRVRRDVADLEQHLKYAESSAQRDELAFRIANVILWTYNTAKGLDQFGKPTVSEGEQEWAKQRLLLLEPAMRENYFL